MDFTFLSKIPLFHGMEETEIEDIMHCFDGYTRKYSKGETIYHMGEIVTKIGIVLSGNVHIEKDDVWGNKSILDSIGPGQVFAETYVCIPGEPLMVSVAASETAEILFMDIGKRLTACEKNCSCHNQLTQNLLMISAHKNLNLSRKIFHTSSKSIRGRLLSYLSEQAARQESMKFTIPFNRQQLAEYLGVDRSAMSNELSKMQKEGMLTFSRNQFCLKGETSGKLYM